MENKKSIILSRTFYPIEGGIQTYLFKVAEKISDKVKVFCKKEKNVPNHLDKPFSIDRYDFREYGYFKSILIMAKILTPGPFSTFFARLHLFLLLVSTRSAITEIAGFTEKVLKQVKNDSEKIDVIYASLPIYIGLIGLILKLKYKKKLVQFIHGKELLVHGKLKNKRKLHKLIFNNADLIIVNSNYTKNLALNLGAAENKIKTILLGADKKKFYPIDSKKEIYEKYNIPENNKLLYTISYLVPRKGNDMVIKALPKVIEKNPNVTYLIGGRGDYKKELLKLVKKNNLEDKVKFTGFIEEVDLNKIMNACDVFIMPCRKDGDDVEGYGIVFMEANACKKPIIVGNSGGAVDAVIDGKTGFLVNPNSKEDIATKILNLISKEKLITELGNNGYDLVTKDRNWEQVTTKINSLISNL